MNPVLKLSQQRILFLDGAMGTLLQKQGLKPGECPETWNLEHPDRILSVHQAYIEAGSDIINTNTFGGNGLKLKEYGLESRLKEINAAGVEIAKKAAKESGRTVFVAASLGPVGEFLKPLGPLTFDELSAIYEAQIEAVAQAGADILNFETMVDIGELRCAVLAAKRVAPGIPLFAHLTFTDSGRTLTGSDPLAGFNILSGLGADFVGMNCGLGPDDMAKLIQGINTLIPSGIVVQANAGIPKLIKGQTVFTCSAHNYIEQLDAVISEGVNVVGGCCGTTPEFIRLMAEQFKDRAPKKAFTLSQTETLLSSPSKTVIIGRNRPFVKIGEKINPSALKKVANDLRTQEISGIKETARAQEEAGAQVLDVNLGLAGTDENQSFARVIPELSSFTRLPLCIDTTHPQALETALKLYPGRALLNSISGEKERMEAVLPLMKTYGAYAILLPLDESGIPETLEGRMAVIERILKEAEKHGLPAARFLVDALVMTVSASPEFAPLSLSTIQEAHRRFGLHSTCGLSNISFGLPGRNALNAAFLTMLMGAGLDSAILNPQEDVMKVFTDAASVLTLRDTHALEYIGRHAQVKSFFSGNSVSGQETPGQSTAPKTLDQNLTWKEALTQCVLEGQSEKLSGLLEKGLKELPAKEILNQIMIPAISRVGDLYEKKEYFLPQLMLSAETMKKGMKILEPALKEAAAEKLGKIVLATVKGDIHDIGKNIVGIILENYGFEVLDLGKDVSHDTILSTAVKEKAQIIALSALMTTTMMEMEKFMDYMKTQGKNIPVMIGGAVVNADYASQIGAVYSKDAVGAVEAAKRILKI